MGYTSWWRNPRNNCLYPKVPPKWWYALYNLWLKDYNDGEIARCLGRTPSVVAVTRGYMNLQTKYPRGRRE